MDTFEKTLLKKTPCNECRVRKRKCSHEQPCARCKKKHIDCVYTLVVSPVDQEYMKELQYIKQIECLESQLCSMENELGLLKLAQKTPAVKFEQIEYTSQYPSPISTHSAHTTPNIYSWFASDQHSSCHDELIAESGDFKVYVSPPRHRIKCFDLSVKKGELSITTSISSHADLLDTLYDLLHSYESKQSPPSLFTQLPSYFHETRTLSLLLWRGYTKQWVKNIAKPMPLKRELESLTVTKETLPSNKVIITTLQLIHAYIGCLHLNQFYIHIPYFMTHFIKPDQPSQTILRSPAVMALCSTICLQRCQHVSAIIPPEASYSYALYYFEQARELISEKFDGFDLETLITYAFMALYKLKLNQDQDTLKYIEMARRIYETLEPFYSNNKRSEESVLFHRISRCIIYVQETVNVHQKIKRGGFNKYGGLQGFLDILKGSDMIPVMLSTQDTPQENEAILFAQLKSQLQQSLYSILLSKPSTQTLTSCIGEYSHQIEMTLRHWYRHKLPAGFQLSLPLFENNLSDSECHTVLEKECGGNAMSPKLLCTIYFYYTYLILGRCYTPKYPNELHPSPDEVHEYLKLLEVKTKARDPSSRIRRTRRWEKYLYRQAHNEVYKLERDGISTEEVKYFHRMFMSIKQDEWNFNLPVAQTAVVAACQLVRLVQYLLSKEHVCFLDYKWLTNACEVLIRASRFKCSILDQGITLQQIRSNINLCIDMIREYSLHEKVERMDLLLQHFKQEFEESLYV